MFEMFRFQVKKPIFRIYYCYYYIRELVYICVYFLMCFTEHFTWARLYLILWRPGRNNFVLFWDGVVCRQNTEYTRGANRFSCIVSFDLTQEFLWSRTFIKIYILALLTEGPFSHRTLLGPLTISLNYQEI